MMKTAPLLLLFAAGIWPAAAQTFDSSGNGMLNGTFYFREVFYVIGDNAGDFQEAAALYNTVTFDGNGNYTMNAILADSNTGLQSGTIKGTYAISASGYGYITNPLSTSDRIFGLVSQAGIFVGSSTESGFNDLFIAAPLASPAPTNATFKGAYTVTDLDLTGNVYYGVAYATGSIFQLNPDGAGNLGTVNISGYVGGGGATAYSQSSANLKYAFSNGAASINFPTSSSATLVSGQKYVYISPDGNFIFGGSPQGFDFFVGVRMGTGTPSFNGLFYQAGIDEDESNFASGGYALLDTYYGSLSAGGGNIIGHQRQSDVFFTSATGFTYGDSYSVGSSGTYTDGYTKYAVGANGTARVGLGIGPYLGMSVALAAPTPSAGSGVYINPQGIVNAASFAPFTAGVSPGDLITIYGSNLAAATQVASSLPFPNTLGGVQVNINGLSAPIYYVTPTQVSAIVPYAVGNSVANIQVVNNNTPSNTVSELINATTPGIFTNPNTGLGYAAALHPDFSLVTSQSPAAIGETISIYLTGLGTVNPVIQDGAAGPSSPPSNTTNTITADVSGVTATVAYAGLAPQLAGLYQINVMIPTGLTAGDNVLDISGPDSYSMEALIPIGTASTSSSAQERPALKHRTSTRAVTPERKRPLPCLGLGRTCGSAQ